MTTNINKKAKRTPTERLHNKQRIPADKARTARWDSRRRSLRNQELPIAVPSIEVPATALLPPRSLRNQELPIAVPSIEVPVAALLPPENSVLQDLISRRTALLQELAELGTAIAVITRTYARES